MNTANKLIAHSCRPSFVCNWLQAACTQYGGEKAKRKNVVRFADGSAVTFTASGLPVEYMGA